MAKKIVIITTGQPSTNPRMLKEYQALKDEDYSVKVLYSFWADWASVADKTLFSNSQLNQSDFILVGGSPSFQKWKYYYSRIRSKLFDVFKLPQREHSLSRTAFFLEISALNEKADLYIAHNLGALRAAVKAAKKYKAKVGFDAEDYHRGEHADQNSPLAKLVKHIEDKYLAQCNYITAASPLICEAYKKLYPCREFLVINNVYSKKYLQKGNKESNVLTLFWFSQTIGPNRGLETAIKAIEILKDQCRIELHLMGNVSSSYSLDLLKLTTTPDCIHFIQPVNPYEVFEVASNFDIGLSLEVPETENRDFCLTNKLFTYLLAGNCVILSNTSAQKHFINSYPGIGYMFNAKSEMKLAELLLYLNNNRKELDKSKNASRQLAGECLNWEKESSKFINLVKRQLN